MEENPDDDLKPERLLFYEKSYNYKKSRYHNRNPLSLLDTPFNRQFPVIYRNRIYYLESEKEVEMVKTEPLKYLV